MRGLHDAWGTAHSILQYHVRGWVGDVIWGLSQWNIK